MVIYMRKISLVFAILSLSALQATYAADGIINFNGTITGTACVVDPSSITQPVELGSVSTTAFSGGNGSTAGAKSFNIVLKSCPASVNSASVRFDGTTNSGNPSILALNAGQTATNIGIAIYEPDSTTLIPIGSSSAKVTLSENVDNTLTYIAKYMSTGSVGAGSANASTSFTIIYQ